MEKAIRRSIEGGYRNGHIWGIEDGFYILQDDHGQRAGKLSIEQILLDPLFWQALAKEEGWKSMCSQCHNGWHYQNPVIEKDSTGNPPRYKPSETGCDHATNTCPDISEGWQYHWHRFIDHLIEGKDVDSFFNQLLK